MKPHNPYTEPDWQHDEVSRRMKARFTCPDCGSRKDYGPRHHRRDDNSERHYRACKNCGFWQEADGSPPYRVWMAVHQCAQRLRPGQLAVDCSVCGQTEEVLLGTSEWPHDCGKYLPPWEMGFHCSNCGQFIGQAHKKTFRSPGSDGTQTKSPDPET